MPIDGPTIVLIPLCPFFLFGDLSSGNPLRTLSRLSVRRPTWSRLCGCRPHSAKKSVAPVLRHDADLLRQRRAAHRARLHHHPRRRAGALPPPARRRRLLPDRHRRARPEGRAGGRRSRHRPAGALRPDGRCASRRSGSKLGHQQRRLHPHHRGAPRARRAGAPRRPDGARRDLPGRLRGLVLRPGRALLDREGRRGRACPDCGRRWSASPRRTTSSA